MELGAFLHPTLTPWILTAYRKTVLAQPRLVGMMYRSQYNKSLNRLAQLALHRIFYTQTADVLKQLKPDTVVCTHPIPNAVVSRLKRLGLKIPLCTLITDYDAHGTWIYPEVNKYLVSTPEVKQKLLQRDVPEEKIEITGIPIHPNFWEQHDKEEIRRKFNLHNMPTVLVMGGGWGMIKNEEWFDVMVEWRDRIQLIFCLGSNEKTKARLSENEKFTHPNVHLLGFTKEIDKLMEVSDLLITKPGGMTCTEAMAKGIPMLFYNPIPGQEEENSQYFTRQGYGRPIETTEDIHYWFRLMLDQYDTLVKRRTMFAETTADYNPFNCSQAILQFLN